MAQKREITARQAKKNLEPFGYKGPARWSSIDAFVKATPRAKMAVTANAGLFLKSGYDGGGLTEEQQKARDKLKMIGPTVSGSGGDYSDLSTFDNYNFKNSPFTLEEFKETARLAGAGGKTQDSSDINVVHGSSGYRHEESDDDTPADTPADTTTDTTTTPTQPSYNVVTNPNVTDPIISEMPTTISLNPSQSEVDAASEIFKRNSDGSFFVDLPTGRKDQPDYVLMDEESAETQGFRLPTQDPTTNSASVQTFSNNQGEDFKQRGIDQAQLIQPQTLAERQAVGQAGKVESQLYQNRLGMTTYVMGQYDTDGTWKPTQGIPQGYYPSRQGASYLVQQAAAAPATATATDQPNETDTETPSEEETSTDNTYYATLVENMKPYIKQLQNGQITNEQFNEIYQEISGKVQTDTVNSGPLSNWAEPQKTLGGYAPKGYYSGPDDAIHKYGEGPYAEQTQAFLDSIGKTFEEYSQGNYQGGMIRGYDNGGTVTVGGQKLTRDQVAQGQADLTAGAILNPKDTVVAAPVKAINPDATGTVMSASTGQANTTAPIVDNTAQVSSIRTSKDNTQRQKVDAEGKPMVDELGKPIMEDITAAKADLSTAQSDVQGELDKVDAQTGSVTKSVTAQEKDTTKVSDLQAAQGTAAKVEDAPTRELQEGETIDGSAVDMKKVEDTFGSGDVNETTADVFEEYEKATEGFKDGKTPAWANATMRKATDRLNQLGLSASSLAGQAVVQAMMEAAMPLAQINTANKQEMAMESARQRAAFMKQDFDQGFQTKVMNAAKVSEIANMNFNAQQQIALENANMAQTMNLANLGNKQALVMAEAAQISQLETTSLNNRQQAQVENARNFLQMDLTNTNNKQATEIFKAQTIANTILSDTAAENANAQFNAANENQVTQFFAQMKTQVSQFNAAQANAMAQFNAGEENTVKKFNSELQAAREQFNAKMYAQIAQANAKWRQDCETANTAAINKSNAQYAKDVNGLTNKAVDEIWQRERDLMNFAYNSSEGAKDRVLSVALADKKLEGVRMQLDAAEDDAFTENIMDLMFGTGGIGNIFGGKGLVGQFF
jgi:hypothetical protein